MLLAGPLGGLLADRLDRRALLIGSDMICAAIMGLLVLALRTAGAGRGRLLRGAAAALEL